MTIHTIEAGVLRVAYQAQGPADGWPCILCHGFPYDIHAACISAALWPERVMALVSGNACTVQDIARSWEPLAPKVEATLWYRYCLHSERGRRGLARDRRAFARLLWRLWSPGWPFDEAAFDRSAESFDNADFVEVVTHSDRHRFGLVPGDPAWSHIETRLSAQPPIGVPTIGIDGSADGVNSGTAHHARHFAGPYQHRVFKGAGHNLSQERPAEWAQAVLDARAMAAGAGWPGFSPAS